MSDIPDDIVERVAVAILAELASFCGDEIASTMDKVDSLGGEMFEAFLTTDNIRAIARAAIAALDDGSQIT